MIERIPTIQNMKDRFKVAGEYGLILHNIAGILLKVQSPDFAARRIFGKEARSPEDETLIQLFMHDNKGIRLVAGMANLLAGHLNHPVPASEKVGITYLCNAVINCDGYIDTSPVFHGLSAEELRRQLLIQPVRTVQGDLVVKPNGTEDLTIGGLIDLAREHVPEVKKPIIDNLFDGLLAAHDSFSQIQPGTYTYGDVMYYREKTNSACIDALAKLMGVENDDIVNQYKNVVHVVQHLDDIGDWILDGKKGNYNLFLGLAKSLEAKNPEEFKKIAEYIDSQPESGPFPKVTKEWLENNVPQTYKEYLHMHFLPLINSFTDRELRVFSWMIKKLTQRILRHVS